MRGGSTPNRWVLLALGIAAQMASCMFLYGIPMLLPALRRQYHLGLADAGWVVTVADNGLGFTAAAELAGSAWAGRALGAQNTAQNVAASFTPPLLGALIASAGYATGFAVAAVFPVLAVAATPVAAELAARRRPAVLQPAD